MSTDAHWYAYDYAVVRVVPRVQVGWFWNVGVVLHARQARFLGIQLRMDLTQLQPFCPTKLRLDVLRQHLAAYECVAHGGTDAGPIGILPPSERFHWLTAPRSAVLQTSSLRAGRSPNLEQTLERLFRELTSICPS